MAYTDSVPPQFFLGLDIRCMSAARDNKAVLMGELSSKHLASVNFLRHIAESSSIPQIVIMHLLEQPPDCKLLHNCNKKWVLTCSYLPVNLPGSKALYMSTMLSWKLSYTSLGIFLPWPSVFREQMLFVFLYLASSDAGRVYV